MNKPNKSIKSDSSGESRCIVPSCKNDSSAATTTLYHFPADRIIRSKWVEAVNSTGSDILSLEDNLQFVRVCSDHFSPDCFLQTAGRKLLKITSVPTLFGDAAAENGKRMQATPKAIREETKKLIEDVLNCTDGLDDPAMTKPTLMFRLKKFPQVCRLCLKAPKSRTKLMVPLDATEHVLDGASIKEFLYDIMPAGTAIDEDKQHLLPNAICMPCLELLRFFARFRSKITTVHLFMNSLVELKHFNSRPMINLFNDKADLLRRVMTDLDLCRLKYYSVEDLLDEFPLYDLASFEGFVIKEEEEDEDDDEEIQQSDHVIALELDQIYADECTAEELTELVKDHIKLTAPESAEAQPPTTKRRRNAVKNSGESCPRKKKIKYEAIETEEPMQCSKCSYSTNFVPNFEKHQRMHARRESRSYPCKNPTCALVFKTYREYYQHSLVAHKSFICETCGLTVSTKNALATHMKRHQKKYEHACPYCDQKRNTKHDMSIHIRKTHLNAMDTACRFCGMTFRGKTALDEHERIHGDHFGFPCKQCDKKFKRWRALTKHVKTVHENFRVICEYCDSSFVSKYHLNNHIEKVHGIQTRFVCDICLVTCTSQEKLDVHRSLHENPHESQCGTCLAVFTSMELSADHLCITYKDDYVCCGKDFRYHLMYNKHMYIKHGIKTNVRVKLVPGQMMGQMIALRKRIETCPKCEQTFATRTLKKQHMEICATVCDAEHQVTMGGITAPVEPE
ncbi:oocyte zinc finger protein XlCOF6-like [Armigeres subalbatus]|uniref:oocyte zinc finger protein XlCOF6-like n=1 Tax=Armigeres subalbatus TaxID=124917 RepID=UPI002ED2E76E